MCEALEHAKEMQTEPNFEVLFAQSFFMGLVAGVILEKRPAEKPLDLKRIAQEYMSEVFEQQKD